MGVSLRGRNQNERRRHHPQNRIRRDRLKAQEAGVERGPDQRGRPCISRVRFGNPDPMHPETLSRGMRGSPPIPRNVKESICESGSIDRCRGMARAIESAPMNGFQILDRRLLGLAGHAQTSLDAGAVHAAEGVEMDALGQPFGPGAGPALRARLIAGPEDHAALRIAHREFPEGNWPWVRRLKPVAVKLKRKSERGWATSRLSRRSRAGATRVRRAWWRRR